MTDRSGMTSVMDKIQYFMFIDWEQISIFGEVYLVYEGEIQFDYEEIELCDSCSSERKF